MSSSKIVKYYCPFCDKRMTREDLVTHVDEEHNELLPEGFTAFRYVFNYVNKKPVDYHGKCTECGGPTPWDENKGRYNRQCDKPACKASFIKKFEDNMMRTKGVTRISSTAEGQEKMLANRKISGKYKFQNGAVKTYTGSYELKALQFMDKVMNINPDDLLCPGPILEYEYEGQKHLYITDFIYLPYNLIIEVKDGGSRPNNRSMPEYRGKQIAKEEYIIKHTDYNYLRLTDNDLSQLLSVFADLKMQMVEKTERRVIHINEAMDALMTGYIPGMNNGECIYMINYMQNNVFSGEPERGYAISDNCKLTNLICRNKQGILQKAPNNFLLNCVYEVYKIDISPEEISRKLHNYIGEFVSEGFVYETIFGKKFYTYDQIAFEESAIPVLDYYVGLNLLEQVVSNFIKGKDKNNICIESLDMLSKVLSDPIEDSEDKTKLLLSLSNGNYRLESVDIPELYLESKNPMKNGSFEEMFLSRLTFGRENNG